MPIKKHPRYCARISILSIPLFCYSHIHSIPMATEEKEIAAHKCIQHQGLAPLQHSLADPYRHFASHFDFLYWQANEDGLEYGTNMLASPVIGAPSQTKTKLLDLNFHWHPGFRLGTSYFFSNFDSWSVAVNWTYMHNNGYGKANALGIESQTGNVDTIISPWVNLIFELRAGASEASAHWHLKYNTVDLDLGKYFPVNKYFALVPFFGFRSAFIHQQYKVDYDSVFLLEEGAPTFHREVSFRAYNLFNGFGLRGGTVLLWHLDSHWHLFSKISAALLYGHFNVKMKNLNDQGLGEGSVPPQPIDFRASEHFWRNRMNLEEAIGFGWETFLKCKQYRLSFQAAYELSQWLSQNQLFYTLYFRGQDAISSVPIRNQGTLSFQGIRLTCALDF